MNMTTDQPEIAALEGCDYASDIYLSWDARRRRRNYFYVLCFLSVLPFMFPLVYKGIMDAPLGWVTLGETGSFSRRQRRILTWIGLSSSAIWLIVLSSVIGWGLAHATNW